MEPTLSYPKSVHSSAALNFLLYILRHFMLLQGTESFLGSSPPGPLLSLHCVHMEMKFIGPLRNEINGSLQHFSTMSLKNTMLRKVLF